MLGLGFCGVDVAGADSPDSRPRLLRATATPAITATAITPMIA